MSSCIIEYLEVLYASVKEYLADNMTPLLLREEVWNCIGKDKDQLDILTPFQPELFWYMIVNLRGTLYCSISMHGY